MLGISDAAEAVGFRTRVSRFTWEQLRDEVPLPCIVHWTANGLLQNWISLVTTVPACEMTLR